MTPDPRDMQTGTKVTFDLPAGAKVDTTLLRNGGKGLHGKLMNAGPVYSFVYWRGGCQITLTDTVERIDGRGEHPGDTYDGATNLHSGEGESDEQASE